MGRRAVCQAGLANPCAVCRAANQHTTAVPLPPARRPWCASAGAEESYEDEEEEEEAAAEEGFEPSQRDRHRLLK